MDRWKSRGGKSQNREEKKKEDQRRERVRGTKVQVREKVEKPRNTVFFQWFVAPEGRKVGLLKRRVRRLVVRWEMEKCTPLRREAHFQVKMHKALQRRTTFGSWDVEKVHAVVARSTLGSCAIEKVYAVVARSTFRSQKCKKMGYGTLLDVQMSFCVAGAGDCAPCQKWAKREQNVRVFIAVSDTMAWDIWRGSGKMHFAWQAQYKRRGRCVRRSGRRFSERGCFLEHEIFRFAKMILHDRCSTSYDLASLFRGRRNTLEVWTGKIANRIGTRPSALHSTFHYWRMLPTWKIE